MLPKLSGALNTDIPARRVVPLGLCDTSPFTVLFRGCLPAHPVCHHPSHICINILDVFCIPTFGPLPSTGRIAENTICALGSLILVLRVSSDLLSIVLGSIVGAYMEEQKVVAVRGMDQLWQSFCTILRTNSKPASHVLGYHIQTKLVFLLLPCTPFQSQPLYFLLDTVVIQLLCLGHYASCSLDYLVSPSCLLESSPLYFPHLFHLLTSVCS